MRRYYCPNCGINNLLKEKEKVNVGYTEDGYYHETVAQEVECSNCGYYFYLNI